MNKESEKYFRKFRLHIEKYVKLGDPEMAHISSYFSINRIDRKTDFLKPGNICRFECFLVSGLFQSEVLDESGKTHTLNFPHEDWWVGDFKSLWSTSPGTPVLNAMSCLLWKIEENKIVEVFNFPQEQYLADNFSIRLLSQAKYGT